MLEIGLVEKSGNHIANVHHLSSGTLKKASASTAEKALSVCFDDLLSELNQKYWLCITDESGSNATIGFCDVFKLSGSGLGHNEVDELLESSGCKIESIHRFNANEGTCTSYVLNGLSGVRVLLEKLFLIEGVDVEYC